MVTEVIAMSKTVGYARVSTNEQNLDRQLQALGQYVEPDMIVTDKASGRNLDRAGYQSLKVGIGKLVSGDTLYITSLDRLSRNKEDLKKELQYFKEKGVKVKILDMPTTMTDFPTEQAWIGDMNTGYAHDHDGFSHRASVDRRHDNEYHDRSAVEHRPE